MNWNDRKIGLKAHKTKEKFYPDNNLEFSQYSINSNTLMYPLLPDSIFSPIQIQSVFRIVISKHLKNVAFAMN